MRKFTKALCAAAAVGYVSVGHAQSTPTESKANPTFSGVVENRAATPTQNKINTTFYGVVDVSAAVRDSGFGKKASLGSNGFSASRFGIRIDAPLVTDLKFESVAEAGLHYDTGDVGNGAQPTGINNGYPSTTANNGTGPQLFARQIYAGISSPTFGKLTAGRQYAVSYILSGIYGVVKNDGLYAYPGALLPIIGSMPSRVNNSLLYASPQMGGFTAMVMATTGSENNIDTPTATGTALTTDRAGRGFDAGISFQQGPLAASLSGWQIKNASYATGETGLANRTGAQIAANYDFGVAKVAVNYLKGKISGGNYENVTKAYSSAEGASITAMVPFGKHRIHVAYSKLDDKSSLDRDAQMYGVGYWYELTSNFRFYGAWGKVKNGPNSTYSLADGGNLTGNVTTPGFSPSGVMAGINFNF